MSRELRLRKFITSRGFVDIHDSLVKTMDGRCDVLLRDILKDCWQAGYDAALADEIPGPAPDHSPFLSAGAGAQVHEEQDMNELQKAYDESGLHGRDLAELEIEARRDAHELQDLRKNPYDKGSFAALVYIDELNKIWRQKHGL